MALMAPVLVPALALALALVQAVQVRLQQKTRRRTSAACVRCCHWTLLLQVRLQPHQLPQ